MNEKHKSPRYECEFCHTTIGTKRNLTKHINGVHKDITKNCIECGRNFTSKRSLLHHISSTHLRSYVCDICENTFDKVLNMQIHYGKVHNY